MKDYGRVRSQGMPPEIEITQYKVYVASNIEPFTEQIDDQTFSGYEYNYVSYDNNEYIRMITEQNTQAISALEEELRVAKILLGVE